MPHPFHWTFLAKGLASTDRERFPEVAGRPRASGIDFSIGPRVRYGSEPGAQPTPCLLDPSRSALELKGFRHPEHVFTPA